MDIHHPSKLVSNFIYTSGVKAAAVNSDNSKVLQWS